MIRLLSVTLTLFAFLSASAQAPCLLRSIDDGANPSPKKLLEIRYNDNGIDVVSYKGFESPRAGYSRYATIPNSCAGEGNNYIDDIQHYKYNSDGTIDSAYISHYEYSSCCCRAPRYETIFWYKYYYDHDGYVTGAVSYAYTRKETYMNQYRTTYTTYAEFSYDSLHNLTSIVNKNTTSGYSNGIETAPSSNYDTTFFEYSDTIRVNPVTLMDFYSDHNFFMPKHSSKLVKRIQYLPSKYRDEFSYRLNENGCIDSMFTKTTGFAKFPSTAVFRYDNPSALSASDRTSEHFTTHPNPSIDGVFNLSFRSTGQAEIEVFDSKGKSLMKTKNNSDTYALDLGGFPSGLFILQIAKDGVISHKKLIKG